MVCKRARDRTEPKSSPLPAKKRRVSLLTKESLDAMNKEASELVTTANATTPQSPIKRIVAVCVSDGSHLSVQSESSASAFRGKATSSALPNPLLLRSNRFTSDAALFQSAIKKRNEEERIRVAKVLLYNAYLDAMNGDSN